MHSVNRSSLAEYVCWICAQVCSVTGRVGQMRAEPRAWAVPPSSFGRRLVADWQRPNPGKGTEALFEAAVVQHVLAFRIYDRRVGRGHTLDQVAFDMPINTQRLGRLLRGELALTLDETLAWQHYLGRDEDLTAKDRVVRENLDHAAQFTGKRAHPIDPD